MEGGPDRDPEEEEEGVEENVGSMDDEQTEMSEVMEVKLMPGNTRSQPAWKQTTKDIVTGAHTDPEVNEMDMKMFPLMDNGDSGFAGRRWVHYLVWRRWMSFGGIIISLCLLGINAYMFDKKLQDKLDTIDRCEEGLDITDGDGNNRLDTISNIEEPFGDYRLWLYEISSRANLALINVTNTSVLSSSFVKSENATLDGSQLYRDDPGWFVGECNWFPFSPWSKVWPASSEDSDPAGTALDPVYSILRRPAEMGCADNGTQFTRSELCVCSMSIQVFRNYSFAPFVEPMMASEADRANGAKGMFSRTYMATQRNLLTFQPQRFCQAKSYDMSRVTSEGVSKQDTLRSAEKCTAAIQTRGSQRSPRRNGPMQAYDGLITLVGDAKVCFVSPNDRRYPAGILPPVRQRRCCSPTEFLYQRAGDSARKRSFDNFIDSGVLLVSINDVFSGVMAWLSWSNWRRSTQFVFWAWFFPFALKFVQFTLPGIEAGHINTTQIADLATTYTFRQLGGWESSDQIMNLIKVFTMDMLRSSMIQSGANRIFQGFACNQGSLECMLYSQGGDDEAALRRLIEQDVAGYWIRSPGGKICSLDGCRGNYSAMAFYSNEPDEWPDEAFPSNYDLPVRAEASLMFSTTPEGSITPHFGDAPFMNVGHQGNYTWRQVGMSNTDYKQEMTMVSSWVADCDQGQDNNCYSVQGSDLLNRWDSGLPYPSFNASAPDFDAYIDRGWLKSYVREWEVTMANWNTLMVQLGTDSSQYYHRVGYEPGSGFNSSWSATFDCKWAANRRYHFVAGLEPNGLCSLPEPYGSQIRRICCEACGSSYYPRVNTYRQLYDHVGYSNELHRGWQSSTNPLGEPVIHWSYPVETYMGFGDKRTADRLMVCDVVGMFKDLSQQNAGRSADVFRDPSLLDTLPGDPALGDCANYSDPRVARRCFRYYTDFLTGAIDVLLPANMDQLLLVAENMMNDLLDRAQVAVNVGYRLQFSTQSAIGLTPIVIALLPGIAKGAMKVMAIIPENFHVGYMFYVVPMLQLPLVALVLAVVTQVIGNWAFYAGTLLFITSQFIPIFGAASKTGPHLSFQHFVASQTVELCGYTVPMIQVQIAVIVLAVAMFMYGLSDLTKDIPWDSILVKANTAQVYLLGVKILLNFFKGKTYTVIMSADMFIRMLMSAARNRLFFPRHAARYDKLMDSAMLMDLPAQCAEEVKQQYPDGVKSKADLKAVQETFSLVSKGLRTAVWRRSMANDKVKAVLRKRRPGVKSNRDSSKITSERSKVSRDGPKSTETQASEGLL